MSHLWGWGGGGGGGVSRYMLSEDVRFEGFEGLKALATIVEIARVDVKFVKVTGA